MAVAFQDHHAQNPKQGGGTDIITNFRLGVDNLNLNTSAGGSPTTISDIEANAGIGGGSILTLSDNTTIKLFGIMPSSIASDLGRARI
jgi:hypothetical protein